MGTPLRVLMIEDSEDDAALLLRELRRGSYDVVSERVDLPDTLKSALDTKPWDLVISDFSMPHFSGTDALRLLRATGSEVPFIFVSGTMGEETAVAALQNGAQDFLVKTNLKRLVPAVQRALREAEERRQRKLMEQQVHQLRKFEAIGKLAGGIAHDFNNVIGAILGWAEMGCEEATPGTSLHDRFQKIRDQSFWAARLTSQLLAFARRQVLQPRNINLNTLAVEGVGLLRRVIGEQIEVRVLTAPDLRVTLADQTQIEQVLMNLCLNARDAMPKADGSSSRLRTSRSMKNTAALTLTHGWDATSCLRCLTQALGWTLRRRNASSSPFSLLRKSGRALGLDWQRCTAS